MTQLGPQFFGDVCGQRRDHQYEWLGDVDRTGFVALLQAMTRTHPRHAARREHEVADAGAQLEAIGYPSGMTRAT